MTTLGETLHSLPSGIAPASTDEFYIVRDPFGDGDDRKLTWAEILAEVVSSIGAVRYLGAIDASTNPNLPAGSAGDLYAISVAGTVSGVAVVAGDMVLCRVDGTPANTPANWDFIQTTTGVVTGPGSSVANDFAMFADTSGKVIADDGLKLDTDGTLAADSDTRVASQKATKTYVDSKIARGDIARAALGFYQDTSMGGLGPNNANDLHAQGGSMSGHIAGFRKGDVVSNLWLYMWQNTSTLSLIKMALYALDGTLLAKTADFKASVNTGSLTEQLLIEPVLAPYTFAADTAAYLSLLFTFSSAVLFSPATVAAPNSATVFQGFLAPGKSLEVVVQAGLADVPSPATFSAFNFNSSTPWIGVS